MAETHWATEEDARRWEAKRREKAASNGHVRAPPKAEPAGYYTKVPNWVFDVARKKDLDAPSTVALLQICRLTFGMHAEATVIGVGQLAARCNFSPATCRRALNRLVEVGLIRRENRADKSGGQLANELRVVLEDGLCL